VRNCRSYKNLLFKITWRLEGNQTIDKRTTLVLNVPFHKPVYFTGTLANEKIQGQHECVPLYKDFLNIVITKSFVITRETK